MPRAGDHADPMTARAAVVGAGPSGFYAADHLLQAGRRGRPVRRAADALRARPRRRRARPPEDQVGDAHLREDRAASGLPLLRRRRARRRRDARGAAGALPRGRLRGGHADRQPAGDPRRRPSGVGRRHRVRRLVQRPPRARGRGVRPVVRARRGDRQRERGDRRRPHAGARPRRARVDRHRRPRHRGVRRRLRDRRGHPRAPRSGAGGVHEPRAARARRADARRRRRRSGRARPRRGSSDDASPTVRRNVDMLRELAARPPAGSLAPDRAALLPLAGRDPRRRGRPGDRPARRPQPARAGPARRRRVPWPPTSTR